MILQIFQKRFLMLKFLGLNLVSQGDALGVSPMDLKLQIPLFQKIKEVGNFIEKNNLDQKKRLDEKKLSFETSLIID